MSSDRIENAVQRIEAALARIADAAEVGPVSTPGADATSAENSSSSVNVSQLVVKHEALREAVLSELERLDDVIGKLEA